MYSQTKYPFFFYDLMRNSVISVLELQISAFKFIYLFTLDLSAKMCILKLYVMIFVLLSYLDHTSGTHFPRPPGDGIGVEYCPHSLHSFETTEGLT